MKASFTTLKVGKEAFTDRQITTYATEPSGLTASAREGPLPSAQPRKLDLHTFPKYVKASLRDPGSLKEAFTDRRH
ncbi:hypothetical protein AMK34_32615 [Amycolatopsis sp. CB00013]|nr:hypothetical protein AMK34_32615 [Amycolatopsis sp. CB00013]